MGVSSQPFTAAATAQGGYRPDLTDQHVTGARKMTTTLTIDVPANEWMTANGRLHWSQRARRTKALRFRARMLARSQRVPHHTGRVRVDYEVSTRTAGRFDPGNAYPTVKAIVDGLTDAGVWTDDSAVTGNYDWEEGGVINWYDAELIVNAPQDLEDLCDEVERLRTALAAKELGQ